ncbi:GNAT family N-acetyltransferase [Candidatus Palauibacter sp.]|uniref:GNAT family N-acetyltransferase n=1 Tax=Candidatus Palauibacter sp. TaxID=3101350 RepID=UPI003B010904
MTEFRELETLDELRACVSLQQTTWGEGFADIVPASVLQVSQKIGGLAGGAFEDGRLIGFVYSLFGRFEGIPAHWSHMLAVEPAARGRGLGRELKLFQREAVRASGIGTIFWTYDPMVARNAHVNLNRLGATVLRYVPNMYGSDTGSPLHAGGDTDRFIVRWDLDGPETRRALREGSARSAERLAVPLPDPARVVPRPDDAERDGDGLPGGDEIFVEIPANVESLSPDRSLVRWRETVRDAVSTYLRRGYEVQSLAANLEADRCFYVLRRS